MRELNIGAAIDYTRQGYQITLIGTTGKEKRRVTINKEEVRETSTEAKKRIEEMLKELQKHYRILNVFIEDENGNVTGYRYSYRGDTREEISAHQERYAVSYLIAQYV